MSTDIRYDARRGRVRLRATDLPVGSVLARVFYRPAHRLRAQLVRGGEVGVTSGAMIRYVDDYEYAAGLDGYWTIEAYSTPQPSSPAHVTWTSGEVKITPPLAEAWLKIVPAPYLNRRILVVGWSDIEREPRTTLYEVRDRADPIAVSSVHSSRKLSIRLCTETLAERDALDASLSAGFPAFLHMPAGAILPSLYCSIGRVRIQRPRAARSHRSYFEVELTEVAPPPPSIVGIADTWATVAAEHTSWSMVGEVHETWRAVMG